MDNVLALLISGAALGVSITTALKLRKLTRLQSKDRKAIVNTNRYVRDITSILDLNIKPRTPSKSYHPPIHVEDEWTETLERALRVELKSDRRQPRFDQPDYYGVPELPRDLDQPDDPLQALARNLGGSQCDP